MRKFLTMFLFLAASLSPITVNAAKGVVIHYESGCDYYIAESAMGFSLLEWFGGNDPSEGDVLVGDFESYGMKEIHNLNADAQTKVWVEDYWLSKNAVIEEYYEQCGD